jgi:hypothetical protein
MRRGGSSTATGTGCGRYVTPDDFFPTESLPKVFPPLHKPDMSEPGDHEAEDDAREAEDRDLEA